MAKIYKSARGKTVDIDKVKLTNETSISVGNMRVNARGDLIGPGGQVSASRNAIMDQIYAVTDAPYSPNDPGTFAQQQAIMEASNAQQLAELTSNLTVPLTPPENDQLTTAVPSTRGSLASSVASPVTVVQEPMPNPKDVKKSNGPSRI